MNRVFAVDDYQNPYLPNKKQAYNKLQRESNMPHFMAQNDFATNGNDGEAMLKCKIPIRYRMAFRLQ
jgi:hypothetical protein